MIETEHYHCYEDADGDYNVAFKPEVDYDKFLNNDYLCLTISIEKWEYIHQLWKSGIHAFSGDAGTCPLCQAYLEWSCEGCPIDRVSDGGCSNTPWIVTSSNDPETALIEARFLRAVRDSEDIKHCIQHELDFFHAEPACPICEEA